MSDNPAVNRVQAILANAFLVLLACALICVGMEIAARVWLRSLASEQDFSRFASLRQLRARGLYPAIHRSQVSRALSSSKLRKW